MAMVEETADQIKVEENPETVTVSAEKPVVKKKAASKKTRASKTAAKKSSAAKAVTVTKAVAKKPEPPKVQDETLAAEKPEGMFAQAIRGTFFAAGQWASQTKKLKNITKIVNWAPVFTGAKTVLNSTKDGVLKIGGTIKSAVTVENIANGTKKVLSSTKEGALKVGGTLKNAIPMEKISEETKKVLNATKQGAVKVGGTIKDAVPMEKIAEGTKKAWTSTREGVSTISRKTASGLTEIGKSFKAGYQAAGAKEAEALADVPDPVLSQKTEAPASEEKPVDVIQANPSTELRPAENEETAVQAQARDAYLEKEVNQIVSEIAEI